jgi:hypothetical protein
VEQGVQGVSPTRLMYQSILVPEHTRLSAATGRAVSADDAAMRSCRPECTKCLQHWYCRRKQTVWQEGPLRVGSRRARDDTRSSFTACSQPRPAYILLTSILVLSRSNTRSYELTKARFSSNNAHGLPSTTGIGIGIRIERLRVIRVLLAYLGTDALPCSMPGLISLPPSRRTPPHSTRTPTRR